MVYSQESSALADERTAMNSHLLSKASIAKSIGVDKNVIQVAVNSTTGLSLKKYQVEPPQFIDAISSYESPAPNKSVRIISEYEKSILATYLDNPKNIELTQYLAFFHLERSLLNSKNKDISDALKHSIIALYFINRAQDLGTKEKWIANGIQKLSKKINKVAVKSKNEKITLNEDHESHNYFIDAFNYHEENRYNSEALLLNDFVQNNSNLHTAHLIEALYLWNAGESVYGDPGIFYDMVLGSYFSTIVIAYAKEVELAFKADPVNNQQYRMATLLGGFTTLYRSWLATLHQDKNATNMLNKEHAKWLNIHKIFIALTYTLQVNRDPDLFESALNAMTISTESCMTQSPPRTCWDHPRFSFNVEGFALTKVDLLLKAGHIEETHKWMHIIKNVFPNFSYWDLGKDAYQHRQDNMDAIVSRYQNNDPTDDPLLYTLKRQKWGQPTMICQGCHQTQSKEWSEEEKNKIMLPPEEFATVGDWPEFTTEWYGAIKNKK